MSEFKKFWDDSHLQYMNKKESYDDWLDKYLDFMPKDKSQILELGCGGGNSTKYLTEKGYNVISTDLSQVALERTKKNVPQAKTMLLDIQEPLPFKDNQFSAVIADLCLHYFDEQKTKEIMQEIKRILKPDGVLCARVNSTLDINHGAGQGKKIEENYYFVEGYKKRFFDVETASKFFKIIGKTQITEGDMMRYKEPKKVIEIISQKEENVK